jgi:gliding motility-associated-like protein
MDIAIIPEIIPVFDPIGPLCQFSIPPVLPGSSLNGITGSWEPDSIDATLPGTFTFIFSADTGQCAANSSLDISIHSIPAVYQVELSDPHCGQPDGHLSITASSPYGSALLFSIDDGIHYQASNSFDNLFAGAYHIKVKDQNGCEASYDLNPVILTDIPGPTVLFVAITNEVNSQHDGSIEISATGNTPNLFYSIDNGNTWVMNTGLFENLSKGTYYCFVKDDSGCDTSFIAEVGNTIIPLTYLTAITGEGDHCLGNAAIVPLEVDKFSDVALFQLKLSYNADNLQCQGYINVHPQMADRLVCWADQLAGEITLQWDDVPPVTFTGKTTILELVFTTKHSGQGQLEWYTNPTISFFADLQGTPIPAEFYTGTLNIYDPPVILIADAKNACEGDKVSIIGAASTTYPPLVYQWTYPDGQISFTDPVFDSVTQYQSGDYTLLVTDSMGCSDQKSIRLVVSDNPLAAFHSADTLRVPLNYILEAGTGLSYYLWNTGAETESIAIQASGMYSVEMISNVGCYGIDSVYVLILTDEPPLECLFVPNAFTPDGDGLNDIFKAVSMCELSFYNMQIYNRWGEKLYETDDISTGWDGKKDGIVLPGDVYVYKITYKEAGTPTEAMNTIKAGSVIIVQ